MTTPVPGTVGQENPEAVAAQIRVKMLDMQIKQYNKQLSMINQKIKGLAGKTDKKSKQALKAAEASRGRVQKLIQIRTEARTASQNKYYELTGQYEQLLEGEGRDAFLAINTLFSQYGLGSLAGKIFEYVKNGYGADTISLLLQDTPEYKKRFAANEARLKAGMSVLSPAEYIAIENSYRQLMRQSGLPTGFYDSNEDFTDWISGDVSPTELQSRVDLATQATALASPSYKAALKQMGLSDGELAAYFLDPDRALPILQKSAATAAIGAEALQRGLTFDQKYSEELATRGIGREEAAQGYAKIADEYSDLKSLGQIYGGGWTQRQAEEDAFTGGTEASAQRERLIGRERGAFTGAVGAARGGFAQSGGAR